ncbi:MBL fold metallo-hydrolase [Streptomyces resistomycificus]|uniref:Beta-lactamase n=1 Tax=Streptomyces resistomycificus TaxID=67356 RepID=A0A0L8L840_9ACTN|nr:MBL fold metallo-hydrolase [Streptomyces resistomycificus]KOG34285.1 beta-lactamase [Streptomyces resistomycificus]KUO01785.1 MBL fold metallo-hydrolase [Streptomyces resistomycificus]
MRLTVLGGCGAWPTAVQACSGYVVEHAGFRLLVDPGYATLPRLLTHTTVDAIDAVLVSHGHPDHCADLNPLLRARGLSDSPPPRLPVFAPHGALDAVLALDKPSMLADAYHLREFWPGERLEIGPFTADTVLLPHFVPNAGIRLRAAGSVLVYTGDTGPSDDIPRLAEGADLFLSEATYVHRVPSPTDAPYLLTARLAGRYGRQAGVARLLLTHLWPGTDPAAAEEAAAEAFDGGLGVATPGLVVDL